MSLSDVDCVDSARNSGNGFDGSYSVAAFIEDTTLLHREDIFRTLRAASKDGSLTRHLSRYLCVHVIHFFTAPEGGGTKTMR